jgi:hypothetical protein
MRTKPLTQELLELLKTNLSKNYSHPITIIEECIERGYEGTFWRMQCLAESFPRKFLGIHYNEHRFLLAANVVPVGPEYDHSAIFYDTSGIGPDLQGIVDSTIKEFAAKNNISQLIPESERKQAYPFFQNA